MAYNPSAPNFPPPGGYPLPSIQESGGYAPPPGMVKYILN